MRKINYLTVLMLISVVAGEVARIPGENLQNELIRDEKKSNLKSEDTFKNTLDKDVCMHNCEMNEAILCFPVCN